MKAKLSVLVICLFLNTCMCQAVENMKVSAVEDFSTENPAKTINVKVMEESILGTHEIRPEAILHCNVLQVVDPKRGKRDATFYVQPVSYKANGHTYSINETIYGKYSTIVLSKDELKDLPYGKIVKKGALLVGDYFVKGLSTGVAFVQGAVQNDEDNRLKSGVKNAYEESPVSYIEKGEQLEIKTGDKFYFVFKTAEDMGEANYSYTIEGETK